MAYRSPVANPILRYGTTRRFLGLGNSLQGPYPLPRCRPFLYGGMGDPKAWMPWPNVRGMLYGGMGNPDAFYRRYAAGMGQTASESDWLAAMQPATPTGPIDIGTSAGVTVTPDTTTVTGQGASAGYQKTTATPQSGTFTDWLNTNSSTVGWIAGIGLGVLLLSRLAK